MHTNEETADMDKQDGLNADAPRMEEDPLLTDNPYDVPRLRAPFSEGEDVSSSSIPVSEKLLAGLLVAFGIFLAVPVLLVFLIKSPMPWDDYFLFGLSYHDIVFVFFLSAALIMVSSLFFIRIRPPVMFGILGLTVVACIPMVIGLTSHLTLQQAILEVPDLAWLPFFLRPAHIFIQFLLPAGILVFLFLQIRGIFSRKPHSYTFLGGVIYLLVASYLGFSIVMQTGEPNLFSVLARGREHSAPVMEPPEAEAPPAWSGSNPVQPEVIPEPVAVPPPAEVAPPIPVPMAEVDPVPAAAAEDRAAIIERLLPKGEGLRTDAAEAKPDPVVSQENVGPAVRVAELEQRLTGMDYKLGQMIVILEQLQSLVVSSRPTADAGAVPPAVDEPPPPVRNEAVLNELARKIELLSERIDQVSGKVPPQENTGKAAGE